MKLEKGIYSTKRTTHHGSVILYCRVAHDDGIALQAQIVEVKSYAKQNGYRDSIIFTDCGSGLSSNLPVRAAKQVRFSNKTQVPLQDFHIL